MRKILSRTLTPVSHKTPVGFRNCWQRMNGNLHRLIECYNSCLTVAYLSSDETGNGGSVILSVAYRRFRNTIRAL